HMMAEYDRIYKASVKPVRLRLFLFPFSADDDDDDGGKQQWFVDALNAVQISSSSASPASENTPDYLFGFDKAVNVNVAKAQQDVVQPVVESSVRPGSECGSEDSNSNSNSNNNRVVEIQNQQQMQINMDPRAYYGDYYTSKIQASAGPGQPRYWQEQRHSYPMSVAGTDSPVYLVPSSAGVYPSAAVAVAAPVPAPVMTMRPAANQGQAYYGM
ncbi:hypothetical protein Tco_0263529, partial [Tanacetum coccineum]